MYPSHAELQVARGEKLRRCSAAPTGSRARLMVVLADVAEAPDLACQVFEVAKRRGLSILLLGVSPDPTYAAQLRRQLITVAALIRQEQAWTSSADSRGVLGNPPEIRTVVGRDWLRQITSLIEPGDTVASCSGQTVGARGSPLFDTLASSMNVPIYVFEGPQTPLRHPGQTLPHVVAWIGSVASIVAFLFLQTQIVLQVQGWAQAAALCLTVGGEVAWIWFLNSVLGSV